MWNHMFHEHCQGSTISCCNRMTIKIQIHFFLTFMKLSTNRNKKSIFEHSMMIQIGSGSGSAGAWDGCILSPFLFNLLRWGGRVKFRPGLVEYWSEDRGNHQQFEICGQFNLADWKGRGPNTFNFENKERNWKVGLHLNIKKQRSLRQQLVEKINDEEIESVQDLIFS